MKSLKDVKASACGLMRSMHEDCFANGSVQHVLKTKNLKGHTHTHTHIHTHKHTHTHTDEVSNIKMFLPTLQQIKNVLAT
jgi:hypothetical protein